MRKYCATSRPVCIITDSFQAIRKYACSVCYTLQQVVENLGASRQVSALA